MRILFLSGAISEFEKCADYSIAAAKMHPYGALCLAAVLEKNGYKDIKILDTELKSLSNRDIVREIRNFRPDIVGVTAYTLAMRKTIPLLADIRSAFSNIVLVAGGPHVTLYPRDLVERRAVDYACAGEGEYGFLELVQAIDKGKEINNIANLVFRDKAEIIHNANRPFIGNLDELPFPSFHLLKDDLNRYYPQPMTYRRKPVVTLITSRGCPHECKFCSLAIWTRRWRFNSASYIVRMARHLVDNFGVKELCLFEDSFAVSKNRVIEFCNLLIKENLDIAWSASVNLRDIDEEIAANMKRAGCWFISCGIETGNDAVMRHINKPLTVKEAEQKLEMIAGLGIKIRGYFMLGHMIDSKQTIRETINFSKSLPLFSANYSVFSPSPGSEFYNTIYPEGGRPECYDSFNNIPGGKGIAFVPDGLTRDYLSRIQKRAFIEFFLRPSQLLIYTRSIRSFEDIRRFAIMFNTAIILIIKLAWAGVKKNFAKA